MRVYRKRQRHEIRNLTMHIQSGDRLVGRLNHRPRSRVRPLDRQVSVPNLLVVDVEFQTALERADRKRLPSDADVAPALVHQLAPNSKLPHIVPSADHGNQVHAHVVEGHPGEALVILGVGAGAEDVLLPVVLVDVQDFLLINHLFPNGEGEAVRAMARVGNASVLSESKVRLDQTLNKRKMSLSTPGFSLIQLN